MNREGLNWNEYRWGHLLLALPIMVGIDVFFSLLRLTTREEKLRKKEDLPSDAIIAVYHPEWLYFMLTPSVWNGKAAWLGIHHFLSYIGSMTAYRWGFTCFRYDRRKGLRPMEAVLDFLRKNPNLPFALRTDSGGPYRRVRESLVTMAIETNRPLVCLRQSGTRYFLWMEHEIPLPFCRVISAAAAPIPAIQLKQMGIEQARNHVQSVMDGLIVVLIP